MADTVYYWPWDKDIPNDNVAESGAAWLNRQPGHGLVLVDRVQTFRNLPLAEQVKAGTAVWSTRSQLIEWRGGAILAAWPTLDLLKRFAGEIDRAAAILVLEWGDSESNGVSGWLHEHSAVDLKDAS